MLLVLAGPSGVGKGSIVRRLLDREPRLWLSVSMTTRAPRPGEVEGREYHFVDRAAFERIRDEGGLLEWFEVYGDLKGTPGGPIEEHLARGADVLVEVDVQGALAVRERFPAAVLVFVRPPSRAAQRERLVARGGDTPAEIDRRLAAAVQEEAHMARFDAVVVNDDLERAVAEVAAILHGRAASDQPGATSAPPDPDPEPEH